jgi:hypothetical protein
MNNGIAHPRCTPCISVIPEHVYANLKRKAICWTQELAKLMITMRDYKKSGGSFPLVPSHLFKKQLILMLMIKIYIELPSNVLDIDQLDLNSHFNLRELIKAKLEHAICEQYLSEITMPEIKVDETEVKDRIITLLAKKALNETQWKN